MKTQIIIFILFLSNFISSGQNFVWAKNFGGSGIVRGIKNAIDASGNLYTVGTFTGTADFDPSASSYTLTSNGGTDAFISKLDISGNFVWAKSLGGSLDDFCSSLKLDASGNVHVVGSFQSAVDFDPGAGIVNKTSIGVNDVFVLKLNSSGSYIWSQNFGSTGSDVGKSITVDGTGNVYTTGSFQVNCDFDPSASTFTLNSNGADDGFISKLDINGNFMWAKSLGSINGDQGTCISIDGTGSVYTAGYFFGTVDFDPSAAVVNLTSAGNNDIFILKLDALGNYMWAKNMGGSSDDVPSSIVIDASNNIYSTGYFNSVADFDPSATTFNLTSAGSYDVFVLKLSASGSFLMAKGFGGTNNEAGNSIAIDASNNIYTTGYYFGVSDFDPSAAVFNLSTVGMEDIFVSKLDFNGNFLWSESMGGSASDQAYSITLDGSSNIYTTGFFSGSADFDPNAGTNILTSTGSNDAFISKLSTSSCTVVPVASSSVTNPLCFGLCNGSAVVNASGGAPFTYSWIGTSSSSSLAIGLCAGSYSCIVTNSCGLSVTNSIVVTQPSAIILNTIISNPTICIGNSTSLIVSASGGTGSTYTFSWSTGSNLSSINVTPTIIPTSNYTINVIDLNGCLSSKILSVTVNPTPTITVTPANANMCAGKTNTITLSGAVNYTTNPGGINLSTFTVSPSSSLTYSVIGLSAQGCSATTTGSVNVITPPSILSTVNTNTICIGSAVTFSNSGGTTYTLNPSSLSGAVINFTPTVVGPITYTIAGSGSFGCINTKTLSVTVFSVPIVGISPSSSTVCTGKSVLIGAGGATTYSWSSGANTNTITLFPTTSSIYTVTGSNSFGCTGTATTAVNIIVTPTISISSPSINVCQGYTMTITASGANNYQWSTGATTNTIIVQPFFANTYSVIGGNGGGCKDTAFISLNILPLPTISAFASPTVACAGQTINLSATGNSINYLWQPGSLLGQVQNVVINATTTYTAFGQGSNGCIFFNPVTVNVNSVSSVTPVASPSLVCAGTSAVLSVIGGAVPSWSLNSIPNTMIVKPIVSTIYTVNVISISGCSSDINFTVNVDNDCALIVYNAFSPNDDGLNDVFYIGNIDQFSNNKVSIYNRWGNKLFETTNYNNVNNVWNGKVNGASVPNGTYFYVINFNDGKDYIKSWVEITN